jgi:subfamily B ATP-binding cassette protein HlyB/CyaB
MWNRELVLMTRRGSLLHLVRRFDISCFMGGIWKYRRMFTEVLVASFFLQIFALVSPLIFQVVIDKVLVHQSVSTLDVLAIGLAGIALFECVLTILRTYLFSHTNRRAGRTRLQASAGAADGLFPHPPRRAIGWPGCASSKTSATS